MPTVRATVEPPYSILFISGDRRSETPAPDGAHLRWSDKAITITCLNEQDGPTSLAMGPASDFLAEGTPVFDGEIETKRREVVVSTAELDVVLRAAVPSTRTRLRIWDNHPTEPDIILIGLN